MAKKEEKEEEKDVLALAIESLNKSIGAGTVFQYKNFKGTGEERVQTGSLGLDYITGGGWPRGRINYLVGWESSSKSTICLYATKEFQKKGGTVLYVDSEQCLTGGSLIYDPEKGGNYSCSELFEAGSEFSVLSYVNGEMKSQKAIIKPTGEKPTYKVTLETGIQLTITGNHEVLTQDGYKRVENLEEGDIMYKPSSVPPSSHLFTGYEDSDLFFLLGFYLADGASLSSVDTPKIYKDDKVILDYIKEVVERYSCKLDYKSDYAYSIASLEVSSYDIDIKKLLDMFTVKKLSVKEISKKIGIGSATVKKELIKAGIPSDYNFRNHSLDLRVLKRSEDTSPVEGVAVLKESKNPIMKFLRRFPETSLLHKEVRIPKNLSDDELRFFLAGYITADGTVVDPDFNHRAQVSVSTSSRIMAKDIEAALLRFGVESNLSTAKKAGYDDCYVVSINGVRNCENFLKAIPIRSYKEERLKRALSSVRRIERSKYTDCRRNLKVKSVELTGKIEPVYDISVKALDYDSQNFICEGAIVHNCFDKNYAEGLGVNVDNLMVCQPDCMEDGYNVIEKLVSTGKIDLVIFDSVAAAQTRRELDGDIGDSAMGVKAKLNSQALPKFLALFRKTNTTGIWVNQYREKLNVSYGSPLTEPASNAIKYAASIKIEVARSTKLLDGTEVVGNLFKANCTKNKTCPPYRTAEYNIEYGEGFDTVHEIFEWGQKFNVISRAGAWYSYGDVKLGNGTAAALGLLRDNPELCEEIEAKVRFLMFDAE